MSTSKQQLIRSLTLIPAVSITLANIIGTGVFVKARVMTCNVGSPGMVLLVWAVAGLLSLAGAMVYAELSTMMPRAGGEFYFIGSAYGRLWAFLFGWTKTLALGASCAALSIISIAFLNDLLGGILPSLALRLLPIVMLAIAVVINLLSARANGGVATAMTVVKILLVLGVGMGAFFFADGNWDQFATSGSEGVCEGVPSKYRCACVLSKCRPGL